MKIEKRKKILEAAEKVVSQKGLSDATISEIARSAGLTDSIIYQYFKGKEDLVYSIPAQRHEEFFSLLNEHLEGIGDVESRLRKIIWIHLRYCDMNPEYASILYFDCLSSLDFYQSSGFDSIRKYAQVLLECLNQGADEGRFRRDVDMHLIRDMILGLVGCEVVSFLAAEEIEAVVPDLEDIMYLIMGLLKPRGETEEGKLDKILNAAERIFAEKGFHKARVADIAKLAGVAEGTVYEYFGNKEDLLLSIPDRHFRRLMDGLPEVFEIKSPIRKMRRLIKYYFSVFFRNENFLRTFLIQVQLTRGFYKTEQFASFVKLYRIIENIIEQGKPDFFDPNVNPRVFRNLFIGTFNNLTLHWFVINADRHIDKMQMIEQVTKMLCLAVQSNMDKAFSSAEKGLSNAN